MVSTRFAHANESGCWGGVCSLTFLRVRKIKKTASNVEEDGDQKNEQTTANKKWRIIFLAILLVTFFGMVKRDPFQWWSDLQRLGMKRSRLESPKGSNLPTIMRFKGRAVTWSMFLFHFFIILPRSMATGSNLMLLDSVNSINLDGICQKNTWWMVPALC